MDQHTPPESESGVDFNFPKKKETAESILSDEDESEDEVISSQKGKKTPTPIAPDAPSASEMPATEPIRGPVPLDMPSSELPTVELRKPTGTTAHTPPVPKPFSPTPPAPIVVHTPPPAAPAAPANPFAFDSAPFPAVPAPQPPGPTPLPIDENAKSDANEPPHRAGGIFKTLVFVLAPYAAVVTALAVYGLFFKSTQKIDPGHPLSTIPDNFGEFDPVTRKKVSQLKVDVDAPLPANLKAGLGGKIEVGQLEIEPLGVESRKLIRIEEPRGGGKPIRTELSTAAMVLSLRIKNTSPDLAIFPLDPAFNRKATVDKVATQLVIGKQAFQGGPFPWPSPELVKRVYEEKQAADATPLNPGQSREYFVCANDHPQIVRAVRQSGDTLLWRVQVRRGLVEVNGKDVPVTAIIGVEFKASDVKNLH